MIGTKRVLKRVMFLVLCTIFPAPLLVLRCQLIAISRLLQAGAKMRNS